MYFYGKLTFHGEKEFKFKLFELRGNSPVVNPHGWVILMSSAEEFPLCGLFATYTFPE